jgi:hypothetical protein
MIKENAFKFYLSGMPASLGEANIRAHLNSAQGLANIQLPSFQRTQHISQDIGQDPGKSDYIGVQDLQVLKEKFPQLAEFSDTFLRSRTMDELLRIESTSLRIKDAERARETEDRLAANKMALSSKYHEVQAGRDNRWNELHPARFLPGAAATAVKQYTTARDVIGLSGPPPLGCYDMSSVGMGGFVTPKGWYELGTVGSSKLKVEYFNINNAAKSSKAIDGEEPVMKDVPEFELALRTLRSAAQFACPWNYSFLALENFLYSKKWCEAELKHDDNPAKTLCQFVNFVIGENASHWRDGSSFLTNSELSGYWSSFIGARPQGKAATSAEFGGILKQSQGQQAKGQGKKRKYPFVDICSKWNTGNCPKAAGTGYNFRGVAMRHCCNWRDPAILNAQPCAGQHQRVGTH